MLHTPNGRTSMRIWHSLVSLLRQAIDGIRRFWRRILSLMVKRSEVFDRKLRDVFWVGDRELAIRMARVCVLFEDLRVEYLGSRAHAELGLDGLSTQYRKFYFLRRSLVSLDEFCGALNRLNEVKAWKNISRVTRTKPAARFGQRPCGSSM